MAIQVGDKFPSVTVKSLGEKGPVDLSTAELCAGKKVVLFAVPGAFTPTCSAAHLPSFVVNADQLKAKGVDTIACMSMNDPFVMGAWAQDRNAEELVMLADGNGDLTRALGLEMDGSVFGLGTRCQRFAMIIDNGKVTTLNVEAPGKYEVSSAEAILKAL